MKDSSFSADKYSSTSKSGTDSEQEKSAATNTTTTPTSVERSEVLKDTETRIPIIEERLEISKRESIEEATITKELITETKTVEVQITYEEITIERRPIKKAVSAAVQAEEGPVQSKTEIKIPLKKEEVEVSKEPYVKEEVVVKKKPVTKTQTVSEQVTHERVKVRSNTGEEKEIM